MGISKQFKLVAFPISPVFPVFYVLFQIMVQVAALAEGAEVGIVVVCLVVVHVGCGEHHTRAGDGMRFVVRGSALGEAGRALAAAPCPLHYSRADFGEPVGRVFGVVNGHGQKGLIGFISKILYWVIYIAINDFYFNPGRF
jgi:hypothetical protein